MLWRLKNIYGVTCSLSWLQPSVRRLYILLTTREKSEKGFGKKERAWDPKDFIIGMRQTCERDANQALEAADREERIDCRSYKSRGIDLEPTLINQTTP